MGRAAILVNYDSVSRGRLNTQAKTEGGGKAKTEHELFPVGSAEGILGVRWNNHRSLAKFQSVDSEYHTLKA